jgi:uncharacterized DUF497 family protein
MEFEWDETKNQQNLAKHGFDFTLAVRIFDDLCAAISIFGRAMSSRIVATGQVGGRFITVVYTRRDGRYRIISARPARSNERF